MDGLWRDGVALVAEAFGVFNRLGETDLDAGLEYFSRPITKLKGSSRRDRCVGTADGERLG